MDVKNKVIKGLFWRFLERCGAQGVTFIVSIVLARLLAPELYGTIALVTVFISILQIFVDSGMANALIQKKDADDLDFSSVFYFNVVLCLVLYGVMYVCSPLIAAFYKNTELTWVVRVMSLTIVISGVKNVQQAYVSKNMLFKKFFFSTLGGTVFSAFVGIVMAYKGFGVWAIVMQNLSNTLIDTIVLWFTVRWKPKWIFSFSRLKSLISYGWKLLVAALIDTGYTNVRQLIIGRIYSPADLGLYNRGKQLPYTIITNVNATIDSVIFPAMSSEQDSKERVKAMARRGIRISSYVMWPLTLGMSFVAPTMIHILLTDKWIGCVPYLRIFCVTYSFYPIHTANLNAIKAMGRSDLFLKLEIIKKIVGVILLVITVPFGVMAMAYSLLVANVCNQIINSWPNKKLLGYKYVEQLKDVMPALLLSMVMGIIIWPIGLLKMHPIAQLTIQVMVGGCVYIMGSKLLKFESYQYLVDIIIKRRKSDE